MRPSLAPFTTAAPSFTAEANDVHPALDRTRVGRGALALREGGA